MNGTLIRNGRERVAFPALGLAKPISQLIAELEYLKAYYGDMPVTVDGIAGVSLKIESEGDDKYVSLS